MHVCQRTLHQQRAVGPSRSYLWSFLEEESGMAD